MTEKPTEQNAQEARSGPEEQEVASPYLPDLPPEEESKLNVRQRRFVSALVNGAPSAAEAYRRAGYAPSTAQAAAVGAANLRNVPNVREEIRRTLEAAGLTRQAMADQLASLLDVRKYGISKDGDRVDVGRDGSTAQKALELAYKLDDALPNPRLDVDATLRGAVVVLRADDLIGGRAFADAPEEIIDVSPAGQ